MLPSPLVAPAVSAFSFDFPRLRIGVAEYSEGPNGVRVLSFPRRACTVATHTSVAPVAIQTAHRESDGDVLFAASVADISPADPNLSFLGVLSFEPAYAAVLKCVSGPFTELENVEMEKS